MSIRKILKVTGNVDKIYLGKLFKSGEYRELDRNDYLDFSKNSSLMDDINNGDTVVNNGSRDLTPEEGVNLMTKYYDADSISVLGLNNLGTDVIDAIKNSPVDIYNGTDVYKASKMVIWTGTASTNSSGYAIVNLTKDGTTNGEAIFSSLFSFNAIAQSSNSGENYQHLVTYTETLNNNKQLKFRSMRGQTVLLGGTSLEPSGQGVTLTVTVIGLK